MKHFTDCPTNRNYTICTCSMLGEEIALVEWKIKEQEGKLHWWNFIEKITIKGAPRIEKTN